MSAVPVYALNDWVHKIRLFEVVDGSITKTPKTDGTASGFFATSDSPTAEAAHAQLQITVDHVEDGWWRVSCDGSLLTPTVLDALETTTLFAVIMQTDNIRVVVECEYIPARTIVAA